MEKKDDLEESINKKKESKMIFKFSEGKLEINENLNDSEKSITFNILMLFGILNSFDPNNII
ncbi:MAG: hypothetical protein ACFFDB_00585 [Promethearchaeota archaeon]